MTSGYRGSAVTVLSVRAGDRLAAEVLSAVEEGVYLGAELDGVLVEEAVAASG